MVRILQALSVLALISAGDWTKGRELLHDLGRIPTMGNMETVDAMTDILGDCELSDVSLIWLDF